MKTFPLTPNDLLKLYRRVFKAVPLGLFVTDENGECIHVNGAWAITTGLTREQSLGFGWLEMVDPVERETLLKQWRAAIHSCEVFQYEFRLEPASTSFKWMMLSGIVPQEWMSSRFAAGFVMDITDRKRLEQQLARVDQTLRQTGRDVLADCSWLAGAAESILLLDRCGQVLVSYHGARFAPEEIVEEDRRRFDEALSQTLESGTAASVELRTLRSGRRWRWFEVTLGRVAVGEEPAVVLVARNIDQRKSMEQRLIDSELRLRAMINDARDSIVTFDTALMISAVNPAAERMFGYSSEELLGMPMSKVIVPCQGERAEGGEVSEGVLPPPFQDGRHWGIYRDGSRFLVEGSFAVSTVRGIRFYTAILRDIATTVAREDQLRREKRRAEMANRAKSQFIVAMSHEIRTPLSAISGFAQLLMMEDTESRVPDELREYVHGIHTASLTLSELVGKILDLSRIETGNITVDPRPVSIRELLGGVQTLCQGRALQRGQQLRLVVDERVPETVIVDPSKLTQIILNLVENAIKYSRPGRSVGIIAESAGRFLEVRVRDEGPPIPAKVARHLFEPYVRGVEINIRESEGFGLGLAIARELAQALGGELRLERTDDTGNLFCLRVPVDNSTQRPAVSRNVRMPKERYSRADYILLIEDDRAAQIVISRFFSKLGAEVAVADNAREGLQMLQQRMPSAIILDIHMPEIDGFEAARRIRSSAAYAHIPIIVVSCDAQIEQQHRAYEVGVNAYLTKPVELNNLVEVVNRFVH